MSCATVIDIRPMTGYWGGGDAQAWADAKLAALDGEAAAIEAALEALDLEGASGLIWDYWQRASGEALDYQIAHQRLDEQIALCGRLGVDDGVAWALLWARERDVWRRARLKAWLPFGAKRHIQELWASGMAAREIDRQVQAWRPFGASVVMSEAEAQALRVGLLKAGELHAPRAGGPLELARI